MIVAKCDPAFAKAEGEKLRKAFRGGDDGARPVDALQRAIEGGGGGVVQSEWRQEDEV